MNTGSEQAGFLSISVVTGLQALREVGIRGDALTEEAPSDRPWLRWDEVYTVLDLFDALVPKAKRAQFVSAWLKRHPTMRASSVLADTPERWLELFWRIQGAVHPVCDYEYEAHDAAHRLRVRMKPGLAHSPVWFELLALVGARAPELLNAPPLRLLSSETTSTGEFEACYAPPERTAPSARPPQSGIPLSTVFSAVTQLRARTSDRELERFRDRAAEGHDLAQRWGLTPRERDVLSSLEQGLTVQEVARELGMSYATARTHLKHIYAKTGARGQRELLARLRGR